MKWTQKEIEYAIELLEERKTYDEIAIELSRSANGIRNKLQELGLKFLDYQKERRKCLQCNVSFDVYHLDSKKFCSSSCSATFNNKIRTVKVKKLRTCICCAKSLTYQKLFCSNKCQGLHLIAQSFKKIENGDTTLGEQRYKAYMIYKHGAKCMKCGWEEIHSITGNVPVQLEHIDGNPDNNEVSNLKLLCPNCHSLTPTYGALNKGNGRDSKRNKLRQRIRLNNKNGA